MITSQELRALVEAVRVERSKADRAKCLCQLCSDVSIAQRRLANALLAAPEVVELVAAAERYAVADNALPGPCVHDLRRWDPEDGYYEAQCDACVPTDVQVAEHQQAAFALLGAALKVGGHHDGK